MQTVTIDTTTYTANFANKPVSAIERDVEYSANFITSTLDRKIETLSSIYSATLDLQQEEDEEDFINKPTDDAVATSFKLLVESFISAIGNVQRPSIFADGYGGLKFSWRVQGKKIELSIPSDEKRSPYLYYECGNVYKIIENIDSARLTQQLNWLNEQSHLAIIFRTLRGGVLSYHSHN